MSSTSVAGQDPAAVPVSGYVAGFADSAQQCDDIATALISSGFASSRITLLTGESGLNVFHDRMQGYSWGEESEQMLRVGEIELKNGHFAIFVEAKDRAEGMQIARIAQSRGGHGLRHFGELTDERLTP